MTTLIALSSQMISGILIGQATSNLQSHLRILCPILLTFLLSSFQGCDYRIVELHEITSLFDYRYYSRQLFELLTLGSLFNGLIINFIWLSRQNHTETVSVFLFASFTVFLLHEEINRTIIQRREPLTIFVFIFFFRIVLELFLLDATSRIPEILLDLFVWFLQSGISIVKS